MKWGVAVGWGKSRFAYNEKTKYYFILRMNAKMAYSWEYECGERKECERGQKAG